MRHIYTSLGVSHRLLKPPSFGYTGGGKGTVLDPDRCLGIKATRAAVIGALVGLPAVQLPDGKPLIMHYPLV